MLEDLPQTPVASQDEALVFIEKNKLMGVGIGYIDVHLLAATALAGDAKLWTRDNRLSRIALKMKLGYRA
jgi:predicted nucleic acid-binding protein